MKKIVNWKRFLCAAASILTVVLLTVPCFAKSEDRLNVIFLHDLHSHIDETVDFDGNSIGGLTRIRTLISEKEKETDIPLLTLDGGDFSMGTLYQTIYTSDAAELRLLGNLGIDVTTLGNHEFDYRTDGLISMLNKAKESGDPLPAFVQSNIEFQDTDKPDSDPAKLAAAFEENDIKRYVMVQKGNLNIAVFGEFGKDSADCAPKSGQTFENICDNAKSIVKEIKEKENPDIIVCLSHSGTSDKKEKSEDEELAEKVPEIDFIVSAHSHTVLENPIVIGDTSIVSCGSYGRKLGTMTLSKKENGRWQIDEYKLVDINASVKEDTAMQQKIDAYAGNLNEYVSMFGFSSGNEVLAKNPYTFVDSEKQNMLHEEYPLATLLADAYIYRVEQAEGPDADPVDIAIVPSGVIRSAYRKGDVTVADAFEVLSLGVGEDGISGYPLVNLYITGKELKSLAELDASIADLMPNYQLHFAGLKFTYNKNRLIFNKMLDTSLVSRDGTETEIEDDKLYRVVSDYYSAQMVGAVQASTKNIIQVTPKNKDGSAITDWTKNILTDDNGEIKAWEATAVYLKSFSKEDGVPVIPEYYSVTHDLKVNTDSHNLIDILKAPNSFCLKVYGIIIFVILVVVLVITGIVKWIKKIRHA